MLQLHLWIPYAASLPFAPTPYPLFVISANNTSSQLNHCHERGNYDCKSVMDTWRTVELMPMTCIDICRLPSPAEFCNDNLSCKVLVPGTFDKMAEFQIVTVNT